MDIRPFGTWPATLSAADVAAGSVRLGGIVVAGERVVWLEGRPSEGGRGVLVEWLGEGRKRDLVPPPYSVRSRVNEYGGGAFWPAAGGIAFVNDADQDIHIVAADGVRRITKTPETRFADGIDDAGRGRLIAIAETGGGALPAQSVAGIDFASGSIVELAAGRDFFAAPRLAPDGGQLAWLTWDLPWMPWQAAEIWLADFGADGTLENARAIGGGRDRAAFQPEWSADGVLHCVLEDETGSRVHRWTGGDWTVAAETPGESGRPLWGLGTRSCAILSDGRIAVSVIDDGRICLWMTAAGGTEAAPVDTGCTDLDAITAAPDGGILAQTRRAGAAPAVECLSAGGAAKVLRQTATVADPADSIAVGRLQSFETPSGRVHAIYYPPTLAGVAGPEGEAPPMIIGVHGGPTGYTDRGYNPKTQYWTQRGFAFLDVDYRGSFGYGPAYRRALDGEMGLLDIGDAVAAALAAAAAGLADPARLLISGGSAGGYVVLGTLAYHDAFAAGCSRYGIGDLKVLADTTHKFEAGYLDTLLGLSGDAESDMVLMRDRSPIHAVDRITAPVLLLQGLDDKVVPPAQSRDMAVALEGKGVPVALVEFEGEGHGFRGAGTVAAALDLEYAFYCRILGLEPAMPLPDIAISNLPERS